MNTVQSTSNVVSSEIEYNQNVMSIKINKLKINLHKRKNVFHPGCNYVFNIVN